MQIETKKAEYAQYRASANDVVGWFNGKTKLRYAAESGNAAEVQKLLAAGANQSTPAYDGSTPLTVATLNGKIDVVKVLLEHPNLAMAIDGATPVYIAAQYGYADVVKMLLENSIDPNQATTKNGTTPVFVAAQNGHAHVLKVLLENNADPNQARTDDGRTALYVAAEKGHVECVKVLLENSADTNQSIAKSKATPMYAAAEKGHANIVKMLLKYNADVNNAKIGACNLKWTPLSIATHNEHTAVADMLKQHGAVCGSDAIPTTVCVRKPLCPSKPYLQNELCSAIKNEKVDAVRKLLLEDGADPSVPGDNDPIRRPLQFVALKGNVELLKMLVESGADPKIPTRTDGVPILGAAMGGNADSHIRLNFMKTLILEYGVDPNQRRQDGNEIGSPPLSTAAGEGLLDVVKLLLEHKADPNLVRKKDRASPLFWASKSCYADVVRVLLEHGANPNIGGVSPLEYSRRNCKSVVTDLLKQYGAY